MYIFLLNCVDPLYLGDDDAKSSSVFDIATMHRQSPDRYFKSILLYPA